MFSLFGDWWEAQNWAQQVFWLTAIVSSLLLAIFSALSLFELSQGNGTEPEHRFPHVFNPRYILAFFTAFGWLALLLSHQHITLLFILLLASAGGLLAAVFTKALIRFFLPLAPGHKPGTEQLMETTGRVLEPIPPHRNGFGKVHINLRDAPYELEAITGGGELKPGVPVRIIGVIDGRVLLVEPLDDEGYPHENQKGSRV
ncbi:MAG: NfeD family protein [Phaeodactylibacter sp.]|nr:NfeD family protein [Phaeodactylibacter sp.]MCB9053703.1 NfeD family protein [Lewinellaceae bacterium]